MLLFDSKHNHCFVYLFLSVMHWFCNVILSHLQRNWGENFAFTFKLALKKLTV